jgi:hypothetical protein
MGMGNRMREDMAHTCSSSLTMFGSSACIGMSNGAKLCRLLHWLVLDRIFEFFELLNLDHQRTAL